MIKTHSAAVATFTVTTALDAKPGSLRQAIINANASPGLDTISFNIGASLNPACNSVSRVCTTTLLTELPDITD